MRGYAALACCFVAAPGATIVVAPRIHRRASFRQMLKHASCSASAPAPDLAADCPRLNGPGIGSSEPTAPDSGTPLQLQRSSWGGRSKSFLDIDQGVEEFERGFCSLGAEDEICVSCTQLFFALEICTVEK